MSLSAHIVAVLLLAVAVGGAQGDTIAYVGPNGGVWNSGVNWSTGALPGAGDIAQFTSGDDLTLDIAGQTVDGLQFDAGGCTIFDASPINTLSVGSSGVNITTGGSQVIFESQILLTTSQIWVNSSSNNQFRLGFKDATKDFLQGGASVTLTKMGGGSLYILGGQSSFAGTLHLKEGRIQYDDANAGPFGDELGTGTLILGDAADPTGGVGLGMARTANTFGGIYSLSGIELAGDLSVNDASRGKVVTTATVPWTITTGPVRLIRLNDGTEGDHSLEILGDIGEAGGSYGLRFEVYEQQPGAVQNDGFASVLLGGENTFTGELQVAVNATVAIDDPTSSSADAQALSSSVVVRLETDGSNYGMLNLVDAIDIQVAGLSLGGVAQGPGTYDASTDPNYFTGDGSLTVVPEPATMGLLALGITVLRLRHRRKTAV